MQTDKTGINGADPAENQTPSYSVEVELEGNEVKPWPYVCFMMRCQLCLLKETEQSSLENLDIAPQACRGKVNTCIIALVVKIKL